MSSVECVVVKGELGAFYRQLTAGLGGGCAPLSVALSSIGAEGIRFVGDSSGSIGPMEVTSRAVSWGGGATCGGWRCRRDSGMTLRGQHQCARKGARVSGH